MGSNPTGPPLANSTKVQSNGPKMLQDSTSRGRLLLCRVATGALWLRLTGYRSDWLMVSMFIGLLSLTVWLLVKGVDLRKWKEKTAVRSLV